MLVFECFQEPAKNNFMAKAAPTWTDLGPHDGAEIGSKSVQEQPMGESAISSGDIECPLAAGFYKRIEEIFHDLNASWTTNSHIILY